MRRLRFSVATVLTACGIETLLARIQSHHNLTSVATVLTACGIETYYLFHNFMMVFKLQQYLPLAVLKR